jgi:hypothetical protein
MKISRHFAYAVILMCAMPIGHSAVAKSAYPVKTTYMPKEFRGKWDLHEGPCGEFDNGSIAFTARTYYSFESVGRVYSVVRMDPDTVNVTMRVTHNGGNTGSETRMQLSADRKTLIVGVQADPDIYHRCTT